MFQNQLVSYAFIFLVLLQITFSIFTYFHPLKRKTKKDENTKKEDRVDKNPLDLFAKEIESYYFSKFICDGDEARNLHKEIPNISDGAFQIFLCLEEKQKELGQDGFVKHYQKLFDQVLKKRAEELDRTYELEKEFRKENKEKEDKRNIFTREEISELLKELTEIERKEEVAERNFWTLHDTLKSLGFETWGNRSYKIYLALKKSYPF
ncbi:MAG: hypothetical protein AB1333_00815 [Patescibacteria group bacterium]